MLQVRYVGQNIAPEVVNQIIGMGLLLPKGLYDLVHEPLSPTTARVISILLDLVLGVILYVIALIKKIMN